MHFSFFILTYKDIHFLSSSSSLLYSLNRLNRLPHHINRFKGPKIFIIYAFEFELQSIQQQISTFTDSSITFIFYVLPYQKTTLRSTTTSSSYTFVSSTNPLKILTKRVPFYPINFLRDIAIEAVQTTHYVFLDCDILISSKME